MYHKLRFTPYSEGTRSSVGIRLTPMSSQQSIVDEIVNKLARKNKLLIKLRKKTENDDSNCI